MFEDIKSRIDQTLDSLIYHQHLLANDSLEDDFVTLFKCYTEERKLVKQLQYQLKSVTSKTRSQSQQIQDQRQRRLFQTTRANRLAKTIQHIYDVVKYRSSTANSIDQLHYIKKLCEDRLREEKSSSDDDEDDADSHNCTIDDEQNESLILHPRVVLPQSSSRKRLLPHDLPKTITPCKRFRTQTTIDFAQGKSRQIIIEHSHDDSSGSSSMNSTKTGSTSSMEQTLPDASKLSMKIPVVTHRFISKKIFRPETCFVCSKRINFGSVSYRCSSCSQSSHVNCKENANDHCRSTMNLPPASPKTPMVSTLKKENRSRLIHSEPRKVSSTVANASTVQRRLPFERILLLKK